MTETLPDIGQPLARYEARDKVTGRTLYAADTPVADLAHAYLITSSIARGRVTTIDGSAAAAIPGVIEIVTHLNAPKIEQAATRKGERMGTSLIPLQSDEIRHAGQIVGMVVADSYETAREAAHLVRVRYEAVEPAATMEAPNAERITPQGLQPIMAGDAKAALASAAAVVDAEYRTPAHVHNPMELFATIAVWKGDELTLYEPTQFVYQLQYGLAHQLGISPAKIHIVNPFIGGAFGSKGGITPRTALVAAVARRIGRPVKLVATREQGFTLSTFRAETRHHVRLGADKTGKLVGYSHEGWELTSRSEDYLVAGMRNSVEMYNVPNIATALTIVRADRNTPGYMRAPADMPYMFALESAMDELAYRLDIDPVELRRRNDTMKSPVDGASYTSRSLMQCFDAAAARFGWEKRQSKPRSMRDGDWLVGWGCATAQHPVFLMAATARVRLTRNGRARVEVAAHELGNGAYTVMGQLAAARLGLPVDRVEVAMGDSRLPPAPIAGGSTTTASVGNAVSMACDRIVARFGGTMPPADRLDDAFSRLGVGLIEEYAEYGPGGPDGPKALQEGLIRAINPLGPRRLRFAFGAEFVEVRVNARTREIRVPRIVGAFASGRILNERTARGQYVGGMVWGIGSALHEAADIDPSCGRYINANIAEYLIPVNADIGDVDIIMVPEVDTEVNPLGIKGIGELGLVGTAAAVANAVYHATGVRVRDLPVNIEKLL
jgi:xanthine dehydrogenase YagR molybdenum-binding subunit